MGQHQLGVPRESRGMDTSLHLCSPSLACSYWISQIQSKKLCSVRGRFKSSNPGLVQCILSLVSSLSAALEQCTGRIYPIPAGRDSQPAEVMDSGDHSRGNVGLSSRDCPKVRSAGASVLPSQHTSGVNSAALRGGSISPFPAETFPKERVRQLMGKEEKEVRENKQPSRNPLHADGWFVLQGDEEPLHMCGVSTWEISPLQVNFGGRKEKK